MLISYLELNIDTIEKKVITGPPRSPLKKRTSVDQDQYYEKVRRLEFLSKLFDLSTTFSAPNDIFANLTLLNITLHDIR